MFSFMNNFMDIYTINKMVNEGTLQVDTSYQRRSVWGVSDKIRLIETILLNLVIPELFFWKADTDPNTGKSTTHIVDGQQRITAIVEFIDNKFKLSPRYLLEEGTKESIQNKTFSQLDDGAKAAFWQYRLTVVEIDPSANKDDIAKMFRRLNLTDYNLNDQEKRNSLSGEFAALSRELSENPFWDRYSLFNATDVRRMKDVEFCASLLLLVKRGIIDQTDQKPLYEAYESYKENYNDADADRNQILKAMEAVERLINDTTQKFVRRKTQLYTLFCVVLYMCREGVDVDDSIVEQFNGFITLYDKMDNDFVFDASLGQVANYVFDLLKKYKLASSEGLNKYANRMIRFNTLKAFLFDLSDDQRTAQSAVDNELIRLRALYSKGDPVADADEE